MNNVLKAVTRRLAFAGLLIAAAGCVSVGRGGIPPKLADGWVVGDPADAGFDAAALDRLTADIESGELLNTHAVLVEHDGVLVYEHYFSGTDELWGDLLGNRVFGPESLHDLRSVSKSVTSVLLGIALEAEFDSAVQKPLPDYLPGLALDEAKRAITLHHALTMTAGLEWNEMDVPWWDPTNDETRHWGVADPTQFVMTRPLVSTPGSTWYYNTCLVQVLATVIYNLTGETVDQYARAHLFEPLGITEFEWLGSRHWTPNNASAGGGLRLRARDLAKIGSVFLHGGRWGGRQVVPEAWVERSVTRLVEVDSRLRTGADGTTWGYGYLWWVGELPSGVRVVAGAGHGGQRLLIVPEERIVVTVFAGDYDLDEIPDERILERVLSAR